MNKLLLGLFIFYSCSNARITQLLGRGAVVRGIRQNLQVLTEVLSIFFTESKTKYAYITRVLTYLSFSKLEVEVVITQKLLFYDHPINHFSPNISFRV
jgi:hypothetical protein